MFATNSYAGSASSGTLSTVHFMSNGVVIASTSGTRSDVPPCAVNQSSRFSIDGTSAGGKVQVSGLLAAYASGKQVNIIGTGNCSVYGDTETISYFYTIN